MIPFDVPLHFLRPWWWLALAALPLVLWLLARSGGGRAAFARLADAVLLPHLVRGPARRMRSALAVLALAWVVGVVALAGPAWRKVPTPLYVNGAARVVVLSLSRDMLAADLKPDRMTRARFAVRDLLDGAGDARTALVAYAGAAFTVAPLTDDRRTVLNFLDALRPDVMPVPGNDAATGIRQGIRLLQQAHVEGGQMVLVTDTAGAAAVSAARAARRDGVRVDVLGIGTRAGAPVPEDGGGFAAGANGLLLAHRDDAALRAVADAGGGRYVVLQPDGGGATRFAAPVATSGHASAGERAQLWRDGGAWLLPALVVLAALAFRRGWLLVVALCVLPLAMPAAHASTWSSLWANRSQRALEALQAGDIPQAKQLAVTPGMRGAVDYRARDYADAAHSFAQGGDARSRYNLGNALAKQGEYQEAIGAYKQALQEDPAFADARANLAAVEAWLKRHPQTPPPQGQPRQDGQRGQPGASPSQRSGPGAPPSSGTAQGQPQAGAQSSASSGARRNRNDAGPGQDVGGASAAQARQQRSEARRATRGVQQEVQRAGKGEAGRDTPRAFALGQSAAGEDSRFNAQQRAMLRSVPDDPGALLRRKFRLEWEQRQAQENGQ